MLTKNISLTIVIIVLIIIGGVLVYAISDYSVSVGEETNSQPLPEVNLNNNRQESNNQDNKKPTPSSTEEVRSLDGIIQSANASNNQLVVKFNYQDQSWTSKVAISDDTFLGASNSDENKTPSKLSFSDFQEGDRVIVSSAQEAIINNASFNASGVVLVE